MSKSKNNGIDPQRLVDTYGADTVRLFTMFTSPPDQTLEWSDAGAEGAYRFLKRLWKIANEQFGVIAPKLDKSTLDRSQADLRRKIHETIVKVNDDIGRRYTFNTAIAAVMELINALNKATDDSDNGKAILREGVEAVTLLLSPIVPHIADAIWRGLGYADSIIDTRWPVADDSTLARDEIELIVQVNGKLRAKIHVAVDEKDDEIKEIALKHENTVRFVEGKEIKKIIIVPKRLVNIVIA